MTHHTDTRRVATRLLPRLARAAATSLVLLALTGIDASAALPHGPGAFPPDARAPGEAQTPPQQTPPQQPPAEPPPQTAPQPPAAQTPARPTTAPQPPPAQPAVDQPGTAQQTAGQPTAPMPAPTPRPTPVPTATPAPPRTTTPPAAPADAGTSDDAAAGGVDADDDAPSFRCARPQRPTFKLGQDHVVRAGESVRELVLVFGSAGIEGEVCGDLVVVFGNVDLGSKSFVRDSLTVVGGSLTVAAGAEVEGDLVVVGGTLDAPASFVPGRDQVLVGIPVVGDRVREFVPWITRGLIFGRLIVPDLAWNWYVVGITLFVVLLLNLLFPRAVGLTTAIIQARPLSALAAGLLVLLLSAPFVTLLAITVIGTAVIPFVALGMFAGWVVGSIAVARWIGASVIAQDDPDDRVASTRSLLIGFAVKVVAYMIPLVGLTVWALGGVLGLGAATMAFLRAFRAENPRKAPPIPPVPPVPPAPVGPPSGPAPAYADEYGPVQPISAAFDEGATGDDVSSEADRPADAASDDDGTRGVPPAPPTRTSRAAFDLRRFPRGAFLERLAAFALDAILVALVNDALDITNGDGAFILWLLVYHIGFWAWKCTTLGGIIMRLRLVKIDGRPLAFTDALVRGLTAIFSIGAAGIGCFWMLRDEQRQTWHDLVAGTLVVKVPRGWPLP